MYVSGSMKKYVIDLSRQRTVDYDWDKITFPHFALTYNGEIIYTQDKSCVLDYDTVLESIHERLIDAVQNQIIVETIDGYKPSSLIAEIRYILAKYRNLDSRILLIALESFSKYAGCHNLQDTRNYLLEFENCISYIKQNIELIDQIDMEIIFELLAKQKKYDASEIEDEKRQKFGILPDEVDDLKISETIKLGSFIAPSRLKEISSLFTNEEFARNVAPVFLLTSSNDRAYDFLTDYMQSRNIDEAIEKNHINSSLVTLSRKRM